jgi:hypothetical protein
VFCASSSAIRCCDDSSVSIFFCRDRRAVCMQIQTHERWERQSSVIFDKPPPTHRGDTCVRTSFTVILAAFVFFAQLFDEGSNRRRSTELVIMEPCRRDTHKCDLAPSIVITYLCSLSFLRGELRFPLTVTLREVTFRVVTGHNWGS